MANHASETISVIVPTYQDGDLLYRCLASIASQTVRPDEIIVVDDGSTAARALSGIEAAIAAFPQARLLRQANGGPSLARNRGVAHACGDWLVFVDADDELAPESLQRRLLLVTGGGQVDAVFGGALFVEPNGRRWSSAWQAFEGVLQSSQIGRRDGLPGVLWAYMIRRETYLALGGLDTTLSIMEDFDLLARLGQSGCRIRGTAETVCIQHRRPASLARGSAIRQMRGALIFLAKARRSGYFSTAELLRRYMRVPLAAIKVALLYGWRRRA